MLTCPFRGRRAAELANNELVQLVEGYLRKGAADLLVGLPSDLPLPARTELVLGFESARSHIMFALSLRLGHWQSAPWSLCAVAHHRHEVLVAALRAGLECRHPHSFCMAFQRPGLRAEAVAVVNGNAALSECHELAEYVGTLRMVPTAERRVEGLHARIHKMTIAAPHAKVPYLSFGLRCQEMSAALSEKPALIEDLAKHLEVVRSSHVLKELDFGAHPAAQAAQRPKHYWPIIYRCDAASQYGCDRDDIMEHMELLEHPQLQPPDIQARDVEASIGICWAAARRGLRGGQKLPKPA